MLLLAACGDPPAPDPPPEQQPRTASQAPETATPTPETQPQKAHTQPSKTETQAPKAATASASPAPNARTSASAFVQVAVGENHACALQADGFVHCWGDDDQDQLNVPDGIRFKQITSGWRFSCGLSTAGEIACWGRNNHKQASPPAGQFLDIDAGWDHACAIGRDGTVCWGRDADGRSLVPPATRFTAIGAGAEHTCGLTHEGSLVCWGKNDNGRANNHAGPFHRLAVGIAHTCALDRDGRVFCQGDNSLGQSDSTPGAYRQLAAGSELTCGLESSGSIHCWGSKRPGQATTGKPTPEARFESIAAGWNSVCGLSDNGYVQCFGYTMNGTLFSPYLTSQTSHPFLVSSISPPHHRLTLIDAFPGRTFEQPIEILEWPGGVLSVVDRRGKITQYDDNRQPKVILDLQDRVYSAGGETGLLSAALAPETSHDESIFLFFTERIDQGKEPPDARLVKIPLKDGTPVYRDEIVILEVIRTTTSNLHYGGTIRFGPDGMLYLGIGDGECFECPQNLSSLQGKILRIDVRNASPERPYQIPDDNPFIQRDDARAEVWAFGLRNPWRMALAEREGFLWVGDVGRATQEEVSLAGSGANLGWPIFEGSECFNIPDSVTERERRILTGYRCGDFTGATQPAVTYGRSWGCPAESRSRCPDTRGLHPLVVYGTPPRCAVVGGFVYRGLSMPWLHGAYFFGDYCSGEVWALDGSADGGWRMSRIVELPYAISSFGIDSDGEIYVLTFGGPILRILEGSHDRATAATNAPGQ
ncbi:MAG: PQQ-dependent sugar dehydrogenase [Chloroflexi bacterium]|nr:PQQ-dependent sugar dehydrogenase [Chloroflexota bacterium]